MAIHRHSYLRRCELVRDAVAGTVHTYWDLFEDPEIEPADDDISHTVVAGDRPDSIAHRYYGSPRLWWVVAAANDLDDPVADLHAGLRLIIPSQRRVLDNIVK